MKVRISYTVDVSDRFRRALNFHYGLTGLATRKDVRDHFKVYGDSLADDLEYELEQYEQEQAEKALDNSLKHR